MKTTIEGARIPGAPIAPGERERREERDAPDERWALALASTLVAELPRLTSPAPADESAAPRAPGVSAAPAGSSPELDDPGGPPGAAGSAAARTSASRASPDTRGSPDLPSILSAEVSDERLGRLELRVERLEDGLDIVINVADARVKALIEAEHAQLLRTLKDAGLRVSSVQIASTARAGTALAQDRAGAEKARAGASFRQPAARWRTYTGSRAEDEDADGEGVDLTA